MKIKIVNAMIATHLLKGVDQFVGTMRSAKSSDEKLKRYEIIQLRLAGSRASGGIGFLTEPSPGEGE
jgi:hypothetical protein